MTPLRLSGLLAALTLACAEPGPVGGSLPRLTEADTDPGRGYERPSVEGASALLPPEIVSGPHHRVREEVASDGFLRVYTIDSDYGRFEVAGDVGVRQRVQEIGAVATLRELRGVPAYSAAETTAAERPWIERWHLIADPSVRPEGLSQEAWQEVLRVAGLSPDARTPEEASLHRAVVAFEAQKRRLARRLAVSAYSTNPALQRELNRAACTLSASDFSLERVPSLVESSVAPVPEDVVPAERVARILAHDAPEDLRRRNRIELAVLGVPSEEIEAFLDHPAFSPLRQTGLVEALIALESARDRAHYLRVALRAETPRDAFFWMMSAFILRHYHLEVAPIARILVLNERTPAAYSREGTLLVGAMVDRLLWTRPVERFADALASAELPGEPVRRRELWLSGSASTKARAEIEGRGVRVVEQVFDRMLERLADEAPRGPGAGSSTAAARRE